MKSYHVRVPAPPSVRDNLREYPELVQDLLYARGIDSPDAAKSFLAPSYEEHAHDPMLMKGMDRAVERVLRAIRNNEHIVLYTDYDADGGPAGVMLHDFFRMIGYGNFSNYIPDRHGEGFGLNTAAVEKFAAEGAKLLITADCGIADVLPVARAQELGIDVIVTDHHEPGATLPPAYAILNPKQEGDGYIFKDLCGSGVAWKLVQALLAHGNFSVMPGKEKWLLDMVGLATLADMVPLTGENRMLAHYGLLVMRKSRRLGLAYLCRAVQIDARHLSEDDIGFMIAPRINAASRMGSAMDAFALLTAEDDVVARERALHLNRINDERKGMVAAMVKEIKKRLALMDSMRDVLVMGSVEWRPSLLGLAANSLMEEYRRPVFLWGREGGSVIKGSCRSDGSVNLVELMQETRETFIDCGGHRMSGGFSLEQDQLHHLEEKLVTAYARVRTESDREEMVPVDRELSIDDVTWDTARHIQKLAPFGEGNPKPLFLFKNITPHEVSQFGRDKNHLKVMTRNGSGKPVSAIAFFAQPEQFTAPLREGVSANIVAHLEISHFRGRPELRLRIVDAI